MSTLVLGPTSRPLSRRAVHFLVFWESLARKRAPTVDPGLPQDPQSVPKTAPRAPKMHPKTDLESLRHAKGTPRGLRGTPLEEKDQKKTQKSLREGPYHRKIAVAASLQWVYKKIWVE